jgi:hypothetical protein
MPTSEELKTVEELEYHYLQKFYYFLKYAEDELLAGFKTKEKIKDDWINKWNPNDEGEKGISSFAVGAERIVYALFNGKGIGQPNSSPIGSDLFFETDIAFIHIDLKTVQTRNIGDYNTSIFVGDNQNSYLGKIAVRGGRDRDYVNAALPFKYKNSGSPKICLTYFVTILYDEASLNILNINLLSMPNGLLKSVYGSKVLKAGKNPGKIRFDFSKTSEFELLESRPKRVKVVYFNKSMKSEWKNNLKLIEQIYHSQNNSG